MGKLLACLALWCLALHPLAGAMAAVPDTEATTAAQSQHPESHQPAAQPDPADCHEPLAADAEAPCLDFCLHGLCCAAPPLQASLAPVTPMRGDYEVHATALILPEPESLLRPPIPAPA